jgi:hypothetical protein
LDFVPPLRWNWRVGEYWLAPCHLVNLGAIRQPHKVLSRRFIRNWAEQVCDLAHR